MSMISNRHRAVVYKYIPVCPKSSAPSPPPSLNHSTFMAGHWSIDPSSISSLSPEDQRLFVQYGLGKTASVPFQTIHEAFQHHAHHRPDAVAVEHLEDTITYGELDRRSDELAHRLRGKGVKPGSRVMLLARRSIPYAVAILAILKAGGVFLVTLGGTEP